MSPYGKAGGNRANRLPCYPLRLQPSLLAEARKVAKSERVSLNQLFNVCVAEKLSALRAKDLSRNDFSAWPPPESCKFWSKRES